ncbi:(4Fe-4S)-binding protein [Agrilactobacillus fermenti]|uniref:(4Fe-4S)-binding protein n=1 Tax=Agrilactobacillus fermenti TaxID=2586909 RepID=UPI001E5FE035|nr:(4Fe-4S)-binding protein [Agrilactobacillus fermenti]MCD2255416.1 (4Fe-4S)-binding protein [Agrilactobacillus fermenti]
MTDIKSHTTFTEAELLAQGYRKYTGKHVDVFFNTNLCQHSGNCVRGLHAVFDLERKPWILADNADPEAVERIINTCPSGALRFIRKD